MNLCIDSRKVQEGDMFFCIDGSALDGHDFAEQAVDNGAKVIVYEHDMPMKDQEGVIYIKVPSTLDALNEAAASLNGWPSKHLTMFGVTGTNGKSSISYLISKIYTKYKGECGYLGTIGGQMEGKKYDVPLTTPDIIPLQRTLEEMRRDGARQRPLRSAPTVSFRSASVRWISIMPSSPTSPGSTWIISRIWKTTSRPNPCSSGI